MASQNASSKAQMSKETLLPALAAHVLEHGLGAASLRPLAKAAGTSDRMLVYHFGKRDELIREVLDYISGVYSAALDAAMGEERAKTRQDVLAKILGHMREPAMQPFLSLWWEIVAGAARGSESHRDAAKQMMDRLLNWLEEQMPEGDPDPNGGARYLLTLAEGAQMLGTIGHGDTAREGLLASEFASEFASKLAGKLASD